MWILASRTFNEMPVVLVSHDLEQSEEVNQRMGMKLECWRGGAGE